jgi:nucleoside-diphosphate-sugar epimerase
MKVLVTGSSGHLGEALMRTMANGPHEAVGVDILPSPFTNVVGSIGDRTVVHRCMQGVGAVLHTATLHKPHVATHCRQDFIDTNITGTLNLLEAAAANRIRSFVFTSTTSTFGDAVTPPPGAAAAWITEDVVPIPKNIYGVTKVAAEDLCQLFHRNQKLSCLVLRTSRFFPEEDDLAERRDAFEDANLKTNELLYRRVDVEDVVSALLLAIDQAPTLGFAKLIITATTPFTRDDAAELGLDVPAVLRRLAPEYEAIYAKLNWKMLPMLDRVYDNARARKLLGWAPRYDFARALHSLSSGIDPRSDLARLVGSKGYHRS